MLGYCFCCKPNWNSHCISVLIHPNQLAWDASTSNSPWWRGRLMSIALFHVPSRYTLHYPVLASAFSYNPSQTPQCREYRHISHIGVLMLIKDLPWCYEQLGNLFSPNRVTLTEMVMETHSLVITSVQDFQLLFTSFYVDMPYVEDLNSLKWTTEYLSVKYFYSGWPSFPYHFSLQRQWTASSNI